MFNRMLAAAAAISVGAFVADDAGAVTTEASHAYLDWGSYASGFDDNHSPSRFDPLNATSQATSGADFFRMGLGSRAAFWWGGKEVIGTSVIFETTWNCNSSTNVGTLVDPIDVCDNFPEQVDVYAFESLDLTQAGTFETPDEADRPNYDFASQMGSGIKLDTVGNAQASSGTGFTVSLDAAKAIDVFFIMLVDTSEALTLPRDSKDGFDINSVTATVIPVPAGLPLLAGAFGLAALARRRSA